MQIVINNILLIKKKYIETKLTFFFKLLQLHRWQQKYQFKNLG